MPRLDLESSVSVSVRSFSRVVALAAVVLPFAAACTAETEPVQEEAASEDELVGGKPESRFRAAGHLVHGATAADAAKAKVSCGATLVAPNVVVTAAHCVQAAKNDVWAFGTGDLGSGELVKVVSVDVHPEFHEAPTTSFDVRYFLKNFDVATLVLERPVTSVTPAALPSEKAAVGRDYTLVGHRASASARGRRVSAKGCVLFRASPRKVAI